MPDSQAGLVRPSGRRRSWAAPVLREVRSIAIIVAVIVVLRSSIFGHYVIPSGSMQPSLKINDHVLANKLAYGLFLPFGDEMVAQWARPRRGDVVIFSSKESDVTLIKRVVGIGGDTISFRDGVLAVNGLLSTEVLQTDRSILSDLGEPASDKDLFVETPPEGPSHHILRQKDGGMTAQHSRDFVVPQGEVFLVGDNRDGSHDSRFWGTIPETRILGRAVMVAYSTTHNAPTSWPLFRPGRFFVSIK